MADHLGNISDAFSISTSTISNIDYGETLTDNMILVDSASVYDVFDAVSLDTMNISDSIEFTNSLSIKKVLDPSLTFSDTSTFYGGYSVVSDSPSNINVTDVGSANTKYTNGLYDIINIDDIVLGNTTLVDSSSQVSDINITDNTSAIVSKDNTSEFKNALLNTVGTTETLLYTCTEYNAHIVNISLANRYNGAITADVIIYRGGSTASYIVKDKDIGISESFVINSNESSILSLSKDDEVRVLSSVDNTLDVYMAVVEI